MLTTPHDAWLRTRCWFEPWTYVHDSWRVLRFEGFPCEVFDGLDVYGKRLFYSTWCQRLNLDMTPPRWWMTDPRSDHLKLFDRHHLESTVCRIGAVAWASQAVFRATWMRQAAVLLAICPDHQWREAIQFSKLKPIAVSTHWDLDATSFPYLFSTGLACLKHSLDVEWPGMWGRVQLCLDAQRISDAQPIIQGLPMVVSASDHKNILFALRSVSSQTRAVTQ